MKVIKLFNDNGDNIFYRKLTRKNHADKLFRIEQRFILIDYSMNSKFNVTSIFLTKVRLLLMPYVASNARCINFFFSMKLGQKTFAGGLI